MKARVRMYRPGLGDCFLLTFWEHESAAPKHVMVDCGVLVGTRGGAEKIREVVAHVMEETPRLEAIVATHEHWDHISGFAQARALFDELEVDEVWLGWTEDPEDPQACSLREDRALRLAGLRTALAAWSARTPADQAVRPGDPQDVTRSALSFFGELPAATEGALAAAGATTQDAWRYLVEERECERRRFLQPGDTFGIRGVKGLRVFVLGPPRDERLLRRDQPSAKAPETYHLGGPGLTACSSLLGAVPRLARGPGEQSGPGVGDPFDAFHRVPIEEAEHHDPFESRYFADDVKWRRIDTDWLEPLGDLALDLDSDTNNTSLVLAFELGDGGDVILMAADAQVGNWMSWADVEFRYRVGSERRRVTGPELLSRVVLYKVGHHASHNATLAEGGLEAMVHDGLVAMIPVDAEMASKKHWSMPFAPLLERLREKTRGRIIRIDEGLPGAAALRRLAPDEREAFRARTREHDLFVEIELDGA